MSTWTTRRQVEIKVEDDEGEVQSHRTSHLQPAAQQQQQPTNHDSQSIPFVLSQSEMGQLSKCFQEIQLDFNKIVNRMSELQSKFNIDPTKAHTEMQSFQKELQCFSKSFQNFLIITRDASSLHESKMPATTTANNRLLVVSPPINPPFSSVPGQPRKRPFEDPPREATYNPKIDRTNGSSFINLADSDDENTTSGHAYDAMKRPAVEPRGRCCEEVQFTPKGLDSRPADENSIKAYNVEDQDGDYMDQSLTKAGHEQPCRNSTKEKGSKAVKISNEVAIQRCSKIQIRHSVGRSRSWLNKHLVDCGLDAQFCQSAFATNQGNLSHIVVSIQMNEFCRDTSNGFQELYVGTGGKNAKTARHLAKSEELIPLFFDPKLNDRCLFYVGHWQVDHTSVKWFNPYMDFMGRERCMFVRLKFRFYNGKIADAMDGATSR